MRLSSALLFGVAGLNLLEAAIDLVFTNTGLSIYKDAFNGEVGSGFGSLAGATFGILVAAGVTILAILNAQGSNNARVTTLVLGGLYLFCGGLLTAANGIHGPARSAGDGPLARMLPAAYGISIGVLDLLIVLATLAALILLAVPPSNRFFHSRSFTYVAVPHPGFATPPPPTRPPPPPPEPHSASIPMADPWAEPPSEYRPRHHNDPPTPA